MWSWFRVSAKLLQSVPAPTTVGAPIMVMPHIVVPMDIIPASTLGRGTYFCRNNKAAGLIRFCGIIFPGKGSRMTWGLLGLTGLAGLKFGFGCALSGS